LILATASMSAAAESRLVRSDLRQNRVISRVVETPCPYVGPAASDACDSAVAR
jgi:hypothetical protein